MIAKVNGLELFYEQRGSGRPLVLLHGNGEDHTIFDESVELLKERFCCYALDTRGHGRSAFIGELHYADMAEDLLAFLEALELRDALVCGFSDGGIVALLAAMETDRITGLVPCGANLRPDGVKPWLRLTVGAMWAFTRDPKLALMLREPNIEPAALGAIRAKTLVLAGSRDLILPAETERIAAAIPGALLKYQHGEGHGSYIVHSDKLARILLDAFPA